MDGTIEVSGIVGAELRRTTSLPLDASTVRAWLVAVHHPDPPPPGVWRLVDGVEELLVPRDLNPFGPLLAWPPGPQAAWGSFDERVERPLGLPVPRTVGPGLNAGMSVRYVGRRLRLGDVVRSVERLGAYERVGRDGLLLLTRLDEEWTAADGELLQLRTWTVARRLAAADG